MSSVVARKNAPRRSGTELKATAAPANRIGRAFGSGIDVGRRDEIGAQQVRDLFGIDAVILVLAAVNGLEVERVGQDKGEAGGLTGIGQPVPAKHAFGADGQVMFVGRNKFEEVVEVVVLDVGVDELFAFLIHQADVHLASMQVDSAVELSSRSVVLHRCS